MKKITAIVSLLALIAATSTKPMEENIFVLHHKKQISEQIEKIKLEKAPDWEKFDKAVNKLLHRLDQLGTTGKQAAANYREQIKKLKQTLVAVPSPTIPTLTTPPPIILPSQLTPLAVLEINIQQLRSNLSEYFNNLLGGKIPIDQFTVKPFIEQVQKLEKDLPKVTTQEKSRIETKLKKLKMGIGKLQITYVTEVLKKAYEDLNIIINKIKFVKTAKEGKRIENGINHISKFLRYADFESKESKIKFADYFNSEIKNLCKQHVIELKKSVQKLRKIAVDVWEKIMDIVKDNAKDKEMRKYLATEVIITLNYIIYKNELVFKKYLDKPNEKFKSAKDNKHPFDQLIDYMKIMTDEA